jgi:hypothetical protein
MVASKRSNSAPNATWSLACHMSVSLNSTRLAQERWRARDTPFAPVKALQVDACVLIH